MNENHSKIEQILKAFGDFIEICDGHTWVQKSTTEDIKSAFKLGHFLEQTLNSFSENNCLPKFTILFNKYFPTHNYTIDDLKTANDMILKKILQVENVPEFKLEVGLRVYTHFYPKARLKNCIKNMIISSNSFLAIKDFVCDSVSSTKSIENKIILKSWSNFILNDKNNTFKNEVNSYLSLYKVESMLTTLLSVLSVTDCTEREILVQKIIMEELLQKMSDRSILSKKFWLTLFKSENQQEICTICCKNKEFLESLFNFIEYLGSMINIEDRKCFIQWKTDINVCICPELGSSEILNLLTYLCQDCSLKQYILTRVLNAKEHGNLEYWENLERELI